MALNVGLSDPPGYAAQLLLPLWRNRLKGRVMILLEERPHTAETVKAITEQVLAPTHTHWEMVRISTYLPSSVSSELAFG